MTLEYPKAPITEAIIDIQISREPRTTIEGLDGIANRLAAKYPQKKVRKVFEGIMQFGATTTASSSQKHDGFVLTDASQKYVIQIHVDGMSVSMLPPYSNWQKFSGEAKGIWKVFKEELGSIELSRVATRYINRIDIPLPIRDFRDFLRTYPELSSDMDPLVGGYYMQIQCPQPDIKSVAILTQGMVPPAAMNVVSILLDIDVSRTVDLPNEDEEMWNLLSQMRETKNRIFEASITNRTRSLFY